MLLLLIGTTGCSGFLNAEEKAIQHLEEKYDKEFEVMWSNKGNIVVHPKGEPEVIFTVEPYNDKGIWIDDYLPAKWGYELQQKLSVDIAKELPVETPFKVTLSAGNDQFDETMVDMSVEEFLINNKDINVSLVAGVKVNGEPDINQYSKGIYNLFQILKNLGVQMYTISIGFVEHSEDISQYIRESFVNNLPWTNLNRRVYGEVNIDDRLDPENPDPIVHPSVIVHGPEDILANYESFDTNKKEEPK